MRCRTIKVIAAKKSLLPAIDRSAFTLVELMVTLVILSMLSAVVTLSVRSYLLKSKQNIARLEISKMMQALDTFFADVDRYPTNEEGLDVLARKSDEFPEALLPFIPSDPWGHSYEYRSPGAEDPYEILCFGADKREGGDGGDKDITSMELSRRKKAKP
jgi:general secretion pathway protein G